MDYEKILSIESGGANRDGLAFAYHLKKSLKVERKNIKSSLSGLTEPADTGYMGSETVKIFKVLSQLILKLTQLPLVLDNPALERIYNNKFYNCQNLDDLSKHLLKSLRRFLISSNTKIKA